MSFRYFWLSFLILLNCIFLPTAIFAGCPKVNEIGINNNRLSAGAWRDLQPPISKPTGSNIRFLGAEGKNPGDGSLTRVMCGYTIDSDDKIFYLHGPSDIKYKVPLGAGWKKVGSDRWICDHKDLNECRFEPAE